MYFEANEGNRAEPLEGISKFHSIWISHGELRGQELSCEKCTISDRCVQCDETVSRVNLESYVHFMESYVHFMRIAIAKALESTRGLLKNFKECT